jgi:hypothetical protein
MRRTKRVIRWMCGFSLGVGLPWLSMPFQAPFPASGYAMPPAMAQVAAPAPKAPAPQIPAATTAQLTTTMVKMANVTRRDVVYEIGGDGQISSTVAKSLGNSGGLHIPVVASSVRSAAQELSGAIAKANLSQANVLFLWLSPELNLQLRPKLLSDLKPGSRIVSYLADMGDWQPDQTQRLPMDPQKPAGQQTLHAWIVPANVQGNWRGSLAVNPGGAPQPFALQFTQQFQQVKGLVAVDGKQVPMQKVTLVGDRLSFSRKETLQGQPVTVIFTGKVDGDTIRGTADLQAGFLSRSFPIVAKRLK